jgi:hypothetical protein
VAAPFEEPSVMETLSVPLMPLPPSTVPDIIPEPESPASMPDLIPIPMLPDIIMDAVLEKPNLRVLYVFAGAERKSDVRHYLSQYSDFTLEMVEIDILRGGKSHDVLSQPVFTGILGDIASAQYDVVVITPPCNTWTRSVWSNTAGPRPVRSRAHPWGFPWLSGKQLKKCSQGNAFIRFTFQVLRACNTVGIPSLVEHPEDLGTTPSGGSPSSIWALEETFAVNAEIGGSSAALFQCSFGTDFPKPTRLWGTLKGIRALPHAQWPKFSQRGYYLGPLPAGCGHTHGKKLVGRNPDGSFKTANTAAYPPAMCAMLASLIREDFLTRKRTNSRPSSAAQGDENASGLEDQSFKDQSPPRRKVILNQALTPTKVTLTPAKVEEDEASSSEDDCGFPKPKLVDHLGGSGPPLEAVWGGKIREFHDGAGLCSPGRWPPERRKISQVPFAVSLRMSLAKILKEFIPDIPKLCMMMACSRLTESPFSKAMIEKVRVAWFESLEAQGGDPDSHARFRTVTPHQPFFLFALARSLELINDPDWRRVELSPDSFVKGTPVGVGVKLPRTPAVYERKMKWRKLDETDFVDEVANYSSIVGALDTIREQFKLEEEMGHMYQLSDEEARSRFPELRVAAQGAIEKSDSSFRVVHDATHGVNVNNDLRVRDQTRMPSCADIRATLGEDSQVPGVHFSLQADVKMAHRRFLHRPQDHGFLACRLDAGSLWINRVGTFGVGSAGYWWGRLAAMISRLCWTLLPNARHGVLHMWMLIYADDLKLTAHGAEKYEALVTAILIWEMIGTPFSWKKLRGGLSQEWLGYWVDYVRFEVGLSEKRAMWLKTWLDGVVSGSPILVRALSEGLGRLGFACGPLEWGRPFLGPLYSWVAALPAGAYLPLPPMVRTTLCWIRDQLAAGNRMSSAKKSTQAGCLFKADAKGEEDYVVLGGYSCSGPLKECKWFSLRLDKEQAPWLFFKGHGSKTIAASELLASLVCVHCFAEKRDDPYAGRIAVTGITDNQGNSYIVAKGMTTKFPVAPVLMELVRQLSSRQLWLALTWAPREENTAADSLTNGDFELFELGNRISLDWAELKTEFSDLSRYVALGESFYGEIAELKKRKAEAQPSRRFKAKKVSDPW